MGLNNLVYSIDNKSFWSLNSKDITRKIYLWYIHDIQTHVNCRFAIYNHKKSASI